MVNTKMLVGIMILCTVLVMQGCNSIVAFRSAKLDSQRGRAYETARFNQILHPDIQNNIDPVEGFDGGAGLNTMDKYQSDFKKEESTTNVFNIHTTAK